MGAESCVPIDDIGFTNPAGPERLYYHSGSVTTPEEAKAELEKYTSTRVTIEKINDGVVGLHMAGVPTVLVMFKGQQHCEAAMAYLERQMGGK